MTLPRVFECVSKQDVSPLVFRCTRQLSSLHGKLNGALSLFIHCSWWKAFSCRARVSVLCFLIHHFLINSSLSDFSRKTQNRSIVQPDSGGGGVRALGGTGDGPLTLVTFDKSFVVGWTQQELNKKVSPCGRVRQEGRVGWGWKSQSEYFVFWKKTYGSRTILCTFQTGCWPCSVRTFRSCFPATEKCLTWKNKRLKTMFDLILYCPLTTQGGRKMPAV